MKAITIIGLVLTVALGTIVPFGLGSIGLILIITCFISEYILHIVAVKELTRAKFQAQADALSADFELSQVIEKHNYIVVEANKMAAIIKELQLESEKTTEADWKEKWKQLHLN